MKVFISWSGERSNKIGEVLRTWLPGVLQLVKPYFTPSDIEKGARWNPDISSELESSNVGIFCMTQDNLSSSWMIFEAGALSKRVEKSRVCPILFGVNPSDLPGPLSQFQATPFARAEIYKLMQTINSTLGENRLEDKTLESVFEMWWPKLERQIKEILDESPENGDTPPLNDTEILLEILELTRLTARRTGTSNGVHSDAAIELLSNYIEVHNSLQDNDSSIVTMGHLEKMKKALRGTLKNASSG